MDNRHSLKHWYCFDLCRFCFSCGGIGIGLNEFYSFHQTKKSYYKQLVGAVYITFKGQQVNCVFFLSLLKTQLTLCSRVTPLLASAWQQAPAQAKMSKKRVAVIGAGASGLAAIKCCLDEGLEPVCIERTSHVGGLWYYQDDVSDGQGSVTYTTVINTSKEMMCYSDFPIPKDFPNFMHNTKVLQYFRLFAKHFNMENYIRFNTEVTSVSRAEDFKQTGKWNLDVCDKATGKTTKETYDAVLICTGHHAEKNVPYFPGQADFKGQIIHTHDFRNHKGFEGKRVVVVGIGNSGVDAAVDLSRIASQVGNRLSHSMIHTVSDMLQTSLSILFNYIVIKGFQLRSFTFVALVRYISAPGEEPGSSTVSALLGHQLTWSAMHAYPDFCAVSCPAP